jgi:hypothetical protein
MSGTGRRVRKTRETHLAVALSTLPGSGWREPVAGEFDNLKQPDGSFMVFDSQEFPDEDSGVRRTRLHEQKREERFLARCEVEIGEAPDNYGEDLSDEPETWTRCTECDRETSKARPVVYFTRLNDYWCKNECGPSELLNQELLDYVLSDSDTDTPEEGAPGGKDETVAKTQQCVISDIARERLLATRAIMSQQKKQLTINNEETKGDHAEAEPVACSQSLQNNHHPEDRTSRSIARLKRRLCMGNLKHYGRIQERSPVFVADPTHVAPALPKRHRPRKHVPQDNGQVGTNDFTGA